MNIKTKSGGVALNRNQPSTPSILRMRTQVRAGTDPTPFPRWSPPKV